MKSTSLDPYLNAMVSDTVYSSVDDGLFSEGDSVAAKKRALHRFTKDELDGLALKSVEHLTRQELLDIVHYVENAISRGTAQLQDYETFIFCQGELTKREQRRAAPVEDAVCIEESSQHS